MSRLILALIMLTSVSGHSQSSTYDFVISGRLTDQTGRPLEGPVALVVKFYHVAVGGQPVLTVSEGLESIQLQEGVFNIKLALDATDYQTVFPSVLQASYFEITDLTHAPKAPYERNQVAVMPYASKIPVDSQIFSFNSTGQLTLAAMPQTGKYLKANANGSLSWDNPVQVSAPEVYTNKTINADNNTITNISNSSIKANAGIEDSKLATISTAGKVSGNAITAGTIAGATAVATSGNISTTGKMGVGVAAGSAQLEIKGSGTTNTSTSLHVKDADGNSRLMVRDDGRVGIGTINPNGKLDVVGGASYFDFTNSNEYSAADYASSSTIYVTNRSSSSANPASGITFITGSNSSEGVGSIGMVKTSANRGALIFKTRHDNNDAERARITSDGKMGIGTTAPQSTLHVVGTLRVDTLASAAATSVCVDANNTLASCSSSRRYKEDIVPLSFGLDAVMATRPVTFKWKNRDEMDLGFIAEEIHDISPLLNHYKDGKIEGVKYSQMAAVLVSALQELATWARNALGKVHQQLVSQQNEFASLKASSAGQDAEIQRLKDENAAMKAVLCELRPDASFCE